MAWRVSLLCGKIIKHSWSAGKTFPAIHCTETDLRTKTQSLDKREGEIGLIE